MGSLRRNLLILCMAVTIATLSAHPRKRLNEQQAISLLLAKYNRLSSDNFLYRLLEVRPLSNQTERQILRFTIQETRCLKSENRNPDQCEFKNDGLVRDCSGQISSAGFRQVFLLSCNTVAGQGQAQEELDTDPSPAPFRGYPGRRRGRRDIEEEPAGLLAARRIRRPYLPRPRFPRPNFPRPRPRPGRSI
ncbi:cathelicidin-7-like [Sminthopsis crassicaudata]|uniref:cathelicidin-7-like n=1 Tax=Sminthopsis crassicaudata TaxID=9301 RepID=UPI003D68BCE5